MKTLQMRDLLQTAVQRWSELGRNIDESLAEEETHSVWLIIQQSR